MWTFLSTAISLVLGRKIGNLVYPNANFFGWVSGGTFVN